MALTGLLIVLAVAGPASAATPCSERVQDDWSDNGRIDGTYAPSCYDQAIADLPADAKYYSEAPDVIEAAKQQMLRDNVRTPSGFGGGGGSNTGGNGSSGESSGGGGDSPLGTILNAGPGAADDIPLPLLILGLIALLLMGAGAAGLISRRMQARTPAGPPDGPDPA